MPHHHRHRTTGVPLWVPAGTVTNAATSGTTTEAALMCLAVDGAGNIHANLNSSNEYIYKITTAGLGTLYTIRNSVTAYAMPVYDPGGGFLWNACYDGTPIFYLEKINPAAPATSPTLYQTAASGSYQAYPQCIGGDGSLWSATQSTDIMSTNTATGVSTLYALPTLGGSSRDSCLAICDGGDGYLYAITRHNTTNTIYLDRMGNGTQGTTLGVWSNVGTISASGGAPAAPASGRRGLAKGSDGNFWSVGSSGNTIYKMTPAGVLTAYTATGTASGPMGLIAAPDGNIWYCEAAGTSPVGKRIVQVNVATGAMTAYPIATAVGLTDMVVGPDNASLYITATGDTKVYKFV